MLLYESHHNPTVGFWWQTIHKKFLRRFDTIFGFKMMMKSGLEKIILKFHSGLPGQFSLSGQIFFALGSSNSEGHRGILK